MLFQTKASHDQLGDFAVVTCHKRNPKRTDPSPLSELWKLQRWHSEPLGKETGLPHKLCHLSAAVALTAFKRSHIYDISPLAEVVKYGHWETLIGGDPKDAA